MNDIVVIKEKNIDYNEDIKEKFQMYGIQRWDADSNDDQNLSKIILLVVRWRTELLSCWW